MNDRPAPSAADTVRGYMDGILAAQAPGPQPHAYWEGHRRGMLDGGHTKVTHEHAQLVRSLRRLNGC